MKSKLLYVSMNGILIGQLEKINQVLRFTYDPKWINTKGARPISLSLPLIEQAFVGEQVYNFFDNLLPDNPLIRNRIQTKFKIQTQQPFDLLASIGKDCVGALQFSEEHPNKLVPAITYKQLSAKEISGILKNYRINPLGMNDIVEDFRISVAGAQEKAAFLYYKKRWNIPLGQTPTSHIFKLPIGSIPHQQLDLTDSCENEWICSLIAEAFGLPVAKCEILKFDDVKILSVERFDRKIAGDDNWIFRLPQEDMCQALGVSPNLKYQSDGGPGINDIMHLLLGSANPEADREYFFRTQILFWLIAAIDGHAKNFSIFLHPDSKYQLTPLYDIISAYPLIDQKQLQVQKVKMAMALKGKNNHYEWYNVQRRHFLETAKFVNYSQERAELLLDQMLERVDSVIQNVNEKLPDDFPSYIAKSIFEGMKKISKRLSKS